MVKIVQGIALRKESYLLDLCQYILRHSVRVCMSVSPVDWRSVKQGTDRQSPEARQTTFRDGSYKLVMPAPKLARRDRHAYSHTAASCGTATCLSSDFFTDTFLPVPQVHYSADKKQKIPASK